MGTFSRETKPGRKIDPWYVTGFAEGEGSFTFSRAGKHMALYFAIKLTAKDEPILVAIQKFLGGIGTIYPVKARKPQTRAGYTKSARYFRVTNIADLEYVIQHFDRYPLCGLKAQSYLIWREMVLLKKNFRNVPIEKLETLAQKLSSLSSRNQPWE